MADVTTEITKQFGINWTHFFARILPFLIVAGLFCLAARSILIRGRGWEVPVWLLLAFFIPVVIWEASRGSRQPLQFNRC